MEIATLFEAAIGAMLVAVIITALAPTVFQNTETVTGNSTYKANNSSAVTIFNLLPLLFGIVGLVIMVAFVKIRSD